MITPSCSLIDKKCIPCERGTPPLNKDQIQTFVKEVSDWIVIDNLKIEKTFKFKNFKQALSFVNKVAEIAEQQGHHPDINLHNWNKVTINLSTHAIKGLSENDFIVAAKINSLI